jgi:phosphoglucosamine mutase
MKLFGTDGIRGVANEEPMTAETALSLGRALALRFGGGGGRPRFVIGLDTRISGEMLGHALAAGIFSAGGDAAWLGVLPTPAVAYAARASGASAGIVVSASHNPYEDNGIKIFGGDGYKLSDAAEAEIEAMLADGKTTELARGTRDMGRMLSMDGEAARAYRGFLKGCIDGGAGRPLSGIHVVLDCANGATYAVAPALFAELGAEVAAIHAAPDGKNINAGCGSQHPGELARTVRATGAQAGLAFDGDGDRLVAVDETGDVLTGDRILAILARAHKESGKLAGDAVVSTVMSNIGLGEALKRMGVRHIRTRVGDRYVMEAMRANGAVLGGEDSGHIICGECHTTGDGLLSALMLLKTMRDAAAPLSALKAVMTVYPQALINVPVASRPPIESLPAVAAAIAAAERSLGEAGRVLVRYSGTQAMCRVMVEGPTPEETERLCGRIAAAVTEAIGSGG